jgi:hypothetical protein
MSYQDDLGVSKSQHLQDHRAATTDAQHRQADTDHASRVLLAGRKWGIKVSGAAQHLANVGAPIPPGSFQPGDL